MRDRSQMSPFAQRLFALRKAADMTQGEVATYLGIDRSAYTYYETDVAMPSLQVLCRLASMFHTSIDFLLDFNPFEKEEAITAEELEELQVVAPRSAHVLSELARDERTLILWFRRMTPEQRKAFLQEAANWSDKN